MSGASVCSNTILGQCYEIFGTDGLDVYKIEKGRVPGLLRKLLQIGGFVDGLLPRDIKAILGRVIEGNFECVFLDSSYFGLVAMALRKSRARCRIVVFYHDVLVDWWSNAASGSALRRWFWGRVYRRVETFSTGAADARIFLTERDRGTLHREYGAEGGAIVPISIRDRFDPELAASAYASRGGSGRVILFVGVDYKPNVEGVSWFIANVLPSLHARLRIVGRGMDAYAGEWSGERIEVVGAVDSLDLEYYRADAVVIPLLSGTGMKVKTAEALMFGKRIFGTPEAFVGYESDSLAAGSLCSEAEEFIAAIRSWEGEGEDPSGISPASRKLFLGKYSFEANLPVMRKALGLDG